MIQTGFKATDKDGKCRGYQYSLPTQNEDGTWTPGEWHEHDGELNLCYSGFHWCLYPSGPWAYYNDHGTRIWNIEADQTAEQPKTPGADYKLVSKRIRLVSAVVIGDDRNTGRWNTGGWNTGHRNTGNRNTGHRNTGDSNTGDGNTGRWNTGDGNTGGWNTGGWNTGNWNTGHRNTGDSNTGRWNTGGWNTGHRNTGDGNTGDGNTGRWNTGGWNTGGWNATDRCSGVFCVKPQTIRSFDVETGLTLYEYLDKYPIASQLGDALLRSEPIPFEPYKGLPGITKAKLKALHAKHLKAREAIR